jgi:hypothetical protein
VADLLVKADMVVQVHQDKETPVVELLPVALQQEAVVVNAQLAARVELVLLQ